MSIVLSDLDGGQGRFQDNHVLKLQFNHKNY